MYFLRSNENGNIILKEEQPTEEMLVGYTLITVEQYQKYLEINELKQKLNETDYKAIKYAEGLLSVEEYEPIKLQRQEWRDKINELEEELE